MRKEIVFFLILVFLQGCQYHLMQDRFVDEQAFLSVSVPYVNGDPDGDLTAAIISEIVRSSSLTYQPQGAKALLLVSIIEFIDENIGFRYDRHKNGTLNHSIIPVETRAEAIFEVALQDVATKNFLLPPVRFKSSLDFDHEYETVRGGINIFSLGQLTDYDAAREAASVPLNQRIAKKIVEYIEIFPKD